MVLSGGTNKKKKVEFFDYIVFWCACFPFFVRIIADLNPVAHQLSAASLGFFSPAALISSPAVMMNKMRHKTKQIDTKTAFHKSRPLFFFFAASCGVICPHPTAVRRFQTRFDCTVYAECSALYFEETRQSGTSDVSLHRGPLLLLVVAPLF